MRDAWDAWLRAGGEDDQETALRARFRSLYVDMLATLREEYGVTSPNAYQIAAYAVWWNTPRALRRPQFGNELATLLGLRDDENFRKWRRRFAAIFGEEQAKRTCTQIIFDYLPDVTWAALQAAIDGGTAGHADREMLLRVAQVYTPTAKHEVSGAGGGPVKMAHLSDDELLAIAAGGGG